MIKETVTCRNLFTEEEETVDLYFHLTEAEITMLNLSTNGKYASFNEEQAGSDEKVKMFETIISKAIGKKTDDGQFIKNDTIRDSFLCSPAYSALLMKFINGEEDINKFILGCLPRDISRKIEVKEDGSINVIE
ncbi:MAG: hypothetical protein J6Y02_19105 [Pseudobutyrivibrio sp.]|nr:hypothetical protein [Pseudobutyrivibrio sp.]